MSVFHPLHIQTELPQRLNNPFDYEPHVLCKQAAEEVVDYLLADATLLADAQQGKMMGVLIVQEPTSDGPRLGFLAAYSGLLAGRNDWDYFVPPVFDAQQPDGHFKTVERQISAMNVRIKEMESAATSTDATLLTEIQQLKQQRKQLSEDLQQWLFKQYRMRNGRGECKDLIEIWRDYHTSPKIQQRFPMPPGGSGDCCAPKLLQYAFLHGMRPLQIAEFWYGESPRGEVRHHLQFYPACRGKCLPILTFMLQGLEVDTTTPADDAMQPSAPVVLYEDADILVIVKPAGLLSVPGRIDAPSVQTLLSDRYGEVFMPHRLDMDTSGLMVVARNEQAYKHLQRQFYDRTIAKRYVALLAGDGRQRTSHEVLEVGECGLISLPLRPDPLDRPRQVVDRVHGKQATTAYEVLPLPSEWQAYGREKGKDFRFVSLVPHTGRTHQLRVHCAHFDGLGTPILGDPLYGKKTIRLCLHAAELAFQHPVSGQRMHFESESHFCEAFHLCSE